MKDDIWDGSVADAYARAFALLRSVKEEDDNDDHDNDDDDDHDDWDDDFDDNHVDDVKEDAHYNRKNDNPGRWTESLPFKWPSQGIPPPTD